jgi:hypothetical protein
MGCGHLPGETTQAVRPAGGTRSGAAVDRWRVRSAPGTDLPPIARSARRGRPGRPRPGRAKQSRAGSGRRHRPDRTGRPAHDASIRGPTGISGRIRRRSPTTGPYRPPFASVRSRSTDRWPAGHAVASATPHESTASPARPTATTRTAPALPRASGSPTNRRAKVVRPTGDRRGLCPDPADRPTIAGQRPTAGHGRGPEWHPVPRTRRRHRTGGDGRIPSSRYEVATGHGIGRGGAPGPNVAPRARPGSLSVFAASRHRASMARAVHSGSSICGT